MPLGAETAIDYLHLVGADDRSAPTVLILLGGPGLSARDGGEAMVDAVRSLTPGSDVVLVDLPATASSSNIHCDRSAEQWYDRTLSASGADDVGFAADAFVEDCLDELGQRDLQSLGTNGNVVALETLRAELDLERWTIVGQSYGARLALAYAGRHPERVASVVLDAPVEPAPTTASWQARATAASDLLSETLDWCANDGACRARFVQDPRAVHESVRDALDTARVDGLGLVGLDLIAAGLLLDPSGRGRFLDLLAASEARGNSWLAEAVTSAPPDGGLNDAAYFATQCTDWSWAAQQPADRVNELTRDARQGGSLAVLLRDLPCVHWPVTPDPPVRTGPVGVPVMVVTSMPDWAAPIDAINALVPIDAARIVVENGPHGSVGWGSPCVDVAIRTWLADLRPRVVVDCAEPFVVLPAQ